MEKKLLNPISKITLFILFSIPVFSFSQTLIDFEDFEGGTFVGTIWNDGGSNCDIVNNVAPNNNYAIKLSSNIPATNDSSSYTDNLDLSAYTSVDITFDFQTTGYTASNDDFYLEYKTNSTWIKMPADGFNIDDPIKFTDGVKYSAQKVTITDTFTATTSFRFRSSAPGDTHILYIDNIKIEGFTVAPTVEAIPADGVWKYIDDGSNQGTAWRANGFDDSSWSSGPALLGFGTITGGTVATTVNYGPDANNKYTTYYFRKEFTIADKSLYQSIDLEAVRDDGMVVYLNGVEVWRDNISGTVDYLTFADSSINNNYESDWITENIESSLLVNGINTIAVEIHQTSLTSSDLSFNFKLTPSVNPTNYLLKAGGNWHYLDDGSNQDLTDWKTNRYMLDGLDGDDWASGNAQLGFGDGDEATAVANNNQITTYFRKTITAGGTDITNNTLKISAIRDDGIVIYINGTEVLRNNMPTGPISYTTTAFGDVTNLNSERDFENYLNVFFVDNPLIAGVNEIAVEIHQYNAASNDISFDLAFETNNDFILVPTIKPDRDLDGVEDYLDADDDNDALPDIVEGCYTSKAETLETDGDGETEILSALPITTVLDDGNTITYSVADKTKFAEINGYNALEHGYGLRVRGNNNTGQLTMEFNEPVANLFFKLIDFDEDEEWSIDVYDDNGNIVDLETEEGIYHLGNFIRFIGNNTIRDIEAGGGPNANNPENRADDIYSAAYFYFPNIDVKKVVFGITQSNVTIRIVGVQYCDLDTDGDLVEDFYDSDSDNDGIPDIVEGGGTDEDGDGKVDNFIDIDGDGVSEPYDTDPNKYFITEAGSLLALDFDYDGILNRVDLDSDNDGIVDLIEAGGVDVNGDGQVDGFIDNDKDGYHDAFDGTSNSLLKTGPGDINGHPTSYPNKNTDGTGFPNFRDIDSDDDGIADHTEAQATTAPFIDYTTGDTDGDGILDVFDFIVGFGGKGLIPVDSEVIPDGIPDYLDLDSDNDGESDLIEGHDHNGDDVIDASDLASCLTSITAFTGKKTGFDIDEDGLDDGYDNNIGKTASNYNPTNEGISPLALPNIDDIATIERDWREPRLFYNFIDFDGFNDYIDFADKHNLTTSFTIEAWVKQDVTSTGNGFIISKTDCNKGTDLGYQFSLVANKPNIKWYDDLGNLVFNLTASHAIGKDRWYYISATYNNATTTAKIYIDGIEVATDNAVPAAPLATTESFLMGAKFDDTNLSQKLSNEFKGWIDEVRIWDVALTEEQLRMMMNQEIESNGTAVRGKVVPVDIPNLLWENLLGYYPMNEIVDGDLIDQSSYTKNGRIRNITTPEDQTAPLPYTSIVAGQNWDTDNTWTNHTVWNVPNSAGVNGTIIDWNIVQASHNITVDRNLTLLGLVVNASSDITIIGSTTSNGTGTGNMLWLTHYLELDGVLDLDGESQLVQKRYNTSQISESILDEDSGGYIERDQQGTANSFNYNYWTSSVGPIGGANNANYTLKEVLFDGTDPSNPNKNGAIQYLSPYAAADGEITSPIKISSYWLYKYNGKSNDYWSWKKIEINTELAAGEGYTMKGTSGDVALATRQNYVFKGKPNNGEINLPIVSQNDRLIGNPYPSALDAEEFIKDNIKLGNGGRNTKNIFNGALYFWDHFGKEDSHYLREYVGGYATYTLMGGARAYANDELINNNGSSGNKIPGRYIPVGQAFFVTAVNDTLKNSVTETIDTDTGILKYGGIITFKNSQRVFVKESDDDGSVDQKPVSVFMKTEKQKETASSSKIIGDVRPKIRLMFSSPKGYHRQLLIGVDENASNNFDLGYDGVIIDIGSEDMYWKAQGAKLVIQAVPNFNVDQEFPLELKIAQTGVATIKVDVLENVDASTDIYIKDALTGKTTKINNEPFQVTLDAGTYTNRFSLTFAPQNTLAVAEDILEQGLLVFMNNITSELQIKNTIQAQITKVTLYNALGQLYGSWTNNLEGQNISIPLLHKASGMYLVQVATSNGTIVKKIIIN